MSAGRDKLSKYEKIINLLVFIISKIPNVVRKKLFEHYRKLKGNKGILIRYILLKSLAKRCGKNVVIFPDVYIMNVQNLELGDNVSIHPMSYIECGEKGIIVIGNNVSIAHGVTIMATNHQYKDQSIPIKYQELIFKKTIINDDVWIGAKATILAGVNIERRAVIAAGAVVNKNVDSGSIMGGVPAKLIKKI